MKKDYPEEQYTCVQFPTYQILYDYLLERKIKSGDLSVIISCDGVDVEKGLSSINCGGGGIV